MDNLSAWSQFVARREQAPPLAFLNGLRNAVPTGVSCPMHSHRAIEIVYHPRGRGVTRLEKNRAVAFDEGDVVVYAPNERHDQVMATPGEDFCLRLAVPAKGLELPKRCFVVPQVEDAVILEDLRQLSTGRVCGNRTEQAIFNLRATSTLFALVQLASARAAVDNGSRTLNYVRKAEHYIREHFADIGSLREVAGPAGIGYDHLRHAVRAVRGRSLVRYLNEVRIGRARTLLLHSRLPLKQIAALCGFRDEYYFSAVFRRLTRMPPGRYRAQKDAPSALLIPRARKRISV